MADVETQLELAPLGTREKAIEISIDVAVTAGADTTTEVEHTFDKPFVKAPKLIGAAHYGVDTALVKGNIQVTEITATTMKVSIYQVLEADVASATYPIKADVVGWVKA